MCTYIYVCMRYVCNCIRMWVMVMHCHCCIVGPYMTDYIMTHSYTCVPPSPLPRLSQALIPNLPLLSSFSETSPTS